MIKPEEIRVGNWIDCRGKYIQVTYHHIRLATIKDILEEKPSYESIPLSPEIMEQLPEWQRRDHLNDWFMKLDDTETILVYKYGQLKICPSNSLPALIVDCAYVHDLQNKVFALTGTELTINL